MEIIQARFLIIADDKQIVDELLEYFESNGFEAEIALSTKTAISIINERKMALLIIGINESKNDGAEYIESIREENQTIPIVAIGGEKSKKLENKVLKAGAQKHIPSPFEKEELLIDIKDMLGLEKKVVEKKKKPKTK